MLGWVRKRMGEKLGERLNKKDDAKNYEKKGEANHNNNAQDADDQCSMDIMCSLVEVKKLLLIS